MEVICDSWVSPEEDIFADVALKFLQRLWRPPLLPTWRCSCGFNLFFFGWRVLYLTLFVLLQQNLLILLPLLGKLALDGGTKDIVILDQRQLVDGQVLRQLPDDNHDQGDCVAEDRVAEDGEN